MLSGAKFIATHLFSLKIAIPQRERIWNHKTEPFVFSTVKGLKFRLDPAQFIDRFIFLHGVYERNFLEYIDRNLSRRGIMLDVGANIGNHALYLAKSFGHVHCFEPNPRAIRILNGNIALNNANNITVHEVGLGETDSMMPFLDEPGSNLGASHFVADPSKANAELPIKSGDGYLAQTGIVGVDFIKIDVEGHEHEVVVGLKETLRRDRPVVAFEHHGQNAGPEVFEELEALGYEFCELVYERPENKFRRLLHWLNTAGAPTVNFFRRPQPRTYENILAIPKN